MHGQVVWRKQVAALTASVRLDVPSGLYYYRVTEADSRVWTGKLVVE
jgi:hypothetical protein